MVSVLWLAVGIAITSTLLGLLVFVFLIPDHISPINALEEKCEKIAKEGFKIHTLYPDLQLDQLPVANMDRLLYLDETWITDCISGLSAESIFNIIQKVELDFRSGE